MKVTDIEVEVGVTKNLGNYESCRLHYRYRVQLCDKDTVADVRQRTFDHLREQALIDINKVVKK